MLWRFHYYRELFYCYKTLKNFKEYCRYRSGEEKTIDKLILKDGSCITLQNKSNINIFKDIFMFKEYKIDGIRLKKKANIIDVGGNVGIFSLWANKEYSQCNVFSYEPSPDTYTFLQKNTENKDNIITFEKAVAAHPGRAHLVVYS